MTRSELLEAMVRAHDREEAAQMGEPSPWSIADRDPEWESERMFCMEAALSAIEQAGLAVVPVEPTEEMLLTQGKSRPDLAKNEKTREIATRLNASIRAMASETWRSMLQSARLK